MINEILLRRKNKIILKLDLNKPSDPGEPIYSYVATIAKNIETLGYVFSEKVFNALTFFSREELKTFYLELVLALKKLVGANVTYHPMYPNFPDSVMKMEETELYINALVHYWSYGTWIPNETEEERLPLFEQAKLTVIELGTEEDLLDIFTNLCQAKTSLSQTDKEDLEWIFKNLTVKFPDEISLKENVALIGKLYLENYPLALAKDIEKYFKTATDVLRLVTAMSEGDISLATNTKYRSFKRKERRIIMDLLENCTPKSLEQDMYRHKNKWIRVGERLHPFEYDKKRYKNVIHVFSVLRNDEKIETFSGKVEDALKKHDYITALTLLKKHPGELARRLDLLLRASDDKNKIVNDFKEVAKDVSTPVLLQVREHFISRNDDLERRVFFPKGDLARSYSMDNTLPEIDTKYCRMIVQICENALVENYSKRDFIGNVYVSKKLKNYVVPFSQRSASKTLKTLVRGSRMPVSENARFARGFVWWTNTPSRRVDIDLSATFFDENWNYVSHISYTNLCDQQLNAVHSGDIVNGGSVDGDGVSEFVDIDINEAAALSARYVVFQLHNYTGIPFSEMPHAMFGWMEREDNQSGQIFEPKTVKQKMDLTAQAVTSIPVIFDCFNREFIWCDMNLSIAGTQYRYGGNNVESNIKGVIATCYAMVNMKKPNLYDLINLNVRARGVLVDDKSEADIIFDEDEGITPFDVDVIMGQYL